MKSYQIGHFKFYQLKYKNAKKDLVFQHPGSLWNHMASQQWNKTFFCELN